MSAVSSVVLRKNGSGSWREPFMNSILFGAAVFALVLFAAVWLHSVLRDRVLRQRWEICLKQAGEIVSGIKRQYPGCDGLMCAITAEPDSRVSGKDGDLAFEQYL